MGRLRAAHIARLRQLSPHPLTFVSFSPFPPNSGASHSAPSPHRGGGGQPRPSCQAPRGVGQVLLAPMPGASPSPTSSVTLGGWCLHEGWGTVKDAGGHEAYFSAAALSIAYVSVGQTRCCRERDFASPCVGGGRWRRSLKPFFLRLKCYFHNRFGGCR